jgi:hypothetical protein
MYVREKEIERAAEEKTASARLRERFFFSSKSSLVRIRAMDVCVYVRVEEKSACVRPKSDNDNVTKLGNDDEEEE